MGTTEIKLVQKPVIEHRVREIGASVTQRLNDLDIDKLVATNDTVKALKELRAELNKELKEYEDQRKYIKKAVTEPYNQFEELYKTEISEKYTDAVSKLKDKIAIVETEIKDAKKKEVETYFNELCAADGLDFLSWDHLGIEINLSTSVKKYKEQINEFVAKVHDELALIDTNVHKAEILAEYKRSMNVAQAIKEVQDRKAREEEEKERLRHQEIRYRIETLEDIGLRFVDVTNTYEYDSLIWIRKQDVEEMDSEQWKKTWIDLSEKVKKAKHDDRAMKQQDKDAPAEATPPPPVSAPVARKVNDEDDPSQRIVTATFQVTGPYTKLKALGQFMRDNGIEYKNL